MRVLMVASYNKKRFAPFIQEQAEALKKTGCEICFFGLQGKGLKGYLKNLPDLLQKIKEFQPDVIHAHYGLSGLFANLQRRIPVVTTYHGSDINERKVLPFSKMSMYMSAWNIFVSQKTMKKANPKKRFTLLPCGVDLVDLQLTGKREARKLMHLNETKRYVLFAGAFDNPVKNASLAKLAVAQLKSDHVELLELKGYSREEVTLLMCAADVLLMTSLNEGSPQVIKEAMACGCPIVSVDVGDVRERLTGVSGCYVATTYDSEALANMLHDVFSFVGKTDGRNRIVSDGLENVAISIKLNKIYDKLLN